MWIQTNFIPQCNDKQNSSNSESTSVDSNNHQAIDKSTSEAPSTPTSDVDNQIAVVESTNSESSSTTCPANAATISGSNNQTALNESPSTSGTSDAANYEPIPGTIAFEKMMRQRANECAEEFKARKPSE